MQMNVTHDFPAANIRVLEVDDRAGVLVLDRDLRDTEGDWFWWCFGVDGAAGRRLVVRFPERDLVGWHGPAVSTDRVDWRWAGHDTVVNRREFAVQVPEDAEVLYLAFSIPYTMEHLQRFLDDRAGDERLRLAELTRSRAGASVPKLELGNPEAERHLVLTARHHACESIASYVMEGIIDGLLEDVPGVLADHLVHAVPMVDYDGVQHGDQGKNRIPHDHARDYIDHPLYPETAAVKRLVDGLPTGALTAFIDLHCPYKWGSEDGSASRNDSVFIPLPPTDWLPKLEPFRSALARASAGHPMPYDGAFDLDDGEAWNRNLPQMPRGYILHNRPEVTVAITMEISYCITQGERVSVDGARQLGRDIAVALQQA